MGLRCFLFIFLLFAHAYDRDKEKGLGEVDMLTLHTAVLYKNRIESHSQENVLLYIIALSVYLLLFFLWFLFSVRPPHRVKDCQRDSRNLEQQLS